MACDNLHEANNSASLRSDISKQLQHVYAKANVTYVNINWLQMQEVKPPTLNAAESKLEISLPISSNPTST